MVSKKISGLLEETGIAGLSKGSSFEEREFAFEKFYQQIKHTDKAKKKYC